VTEKEELIEVLVNLEEEKTYKLVEKFLEDGMDPQKIIDILREGVDIIGEKYNQKEYFLTELVMAGEIFQNSAKIIQPELKKAMDSEESLGKVVIGTVKGDVHDIGKNIFVTLMKSAGFEVYDLGVDVPPEKFLEKVDEVNADVVCYSGLLTVALESMEKTTETLKKAGLKDKIKIIIGGLPVDEMWKEKAGADAFTDNAFEGVKIVKNWMGA